MKQKFFTTIAGVMSFGIYFALINTLIYYFDYHHQKDKNIHFVKKNESYIKVSLSSPPPPKSTDKKVVKKEPKSNPKKIEKKITPKKTEASKKVVEKKSVEKKEPKKIIKEKVVKKVTTKKEPKKEVKKEKVIKKENKPKVSNTKELFDSIETKYKPPKKTSTTKNSTQSIDSLFGGYGNSKPKSTTTNTTGAEESRDSGVVNPYFAKVEKMLFGWPAQSEFAGQKATVWIRIEPSGKFRFRVTTASRNPEFNRGLIEYLRELQKSGFGRHEANRAYELEIEFIAKL